MVILMLLAILSPGQLHIFASNTEHPTINDYSEEIEFASVVCMFDDMLREISHCH